MALVFTKLTYEQFERLRPDSTSYEETEVDGHHVMVCYGEGDAVDFKGAVVGRVCVGMYYTRAGFATRCEAHKGCLVAYAERDTHWPYGN